MICILTHVVISVNCSSCVRTGSSVLFFPVRVLLVWARGWDYLSKILSSQPSSSMNAILIPPRSCMLSCLERTVMSVWLILAKTKNRCPRFAATPLLAEGETICQEIHSHIYFLPIRLISLLILAFGIKQYPHTWLHYRTKVILRGSVPAPEKWCFTTWEIFFSQH